MKKILFAIAVPLILAGCQNQELPDYEAGNGLYFFHADYAAGGGQKDSVQVAFYTKQVETNGRYVQNIDIRLSGEPSDKPRAFKLRQTNLGEVTAALPGRHFVPLDDPSMEKLMVFPAGATQYTLPITLLNDEGLQNQRVRLELEIVPNENFRQAAEVWSKFVILASDMVVKPTSWKNNEPSLSWWYWFGDYSAMKMRYITIETGLFDFDLAMYGNDADGIESISTTRKRNFSIKMFLLLEKYNEEHPGAPMLDENRNPITFPDRQQHA